MIPQRGYTLTVNGDAWKTSPGDWAGSDSRLKTNLNNLDSKDVLRKVNTLNGLTYFWNDNQTEYKRPGGQQIGFTAQDLQNSFPLLVRKGEDGFLSACYDPMDAILVEAIKALTMKIDSLETVISTNNRSRPDEQFSEDDTISENLTLKYPESITLSQNNPNPFAEKTEIKYSVPLTNQKCEIVFYDSLGNSIVSKELQVTLNGVLHVFGSDISAGSYTYCLFVDGKLALCKKLIKN